MRIQRPTDFLIKINEVKSSEGVVLNPLEVYLLFVIRDKFGNEYRAVSDPSGVDTKNTTIVDGVLYIAVENYKLVGCLAMSVGIKTTDEQFPDGYCTAYSQYKPIAGVELI